jgi:hypothetical protein
MAAGLAQILLSFLGHWEIVEYPQKTPHRHTKDDMVGEQVEILLTIIRLGSASMMTGLEDSEPHISVPPPLAAY